MNNIMFDPQLQLPTTNLTANFNKYPCTRSHLNLPVGNVADHCSKWHRMDSPPCTHTHTHTRVIRTQSKCWSTDIACWK